MRYIPLTEPPPDDKWLQKANQILEELKAAPDAQTRKEIIDRNSRIWGELKGWLLTQSHQKCWFSEAKECVSHWDVEHFRPKKSVKDEDGTEHEGYWWLAFDWHNFRICGNALNRKKGTFFPIRQGCQRVTSPDGDLRFEDPQLLDPVDPEDPGLLSFDMEGRAIPAPHVKDEWQKLRVTYSVERFNLDFPPLMDKRKVRWQECSQRIQTYRNELIKYHNNKENLIAKESFKQAAMDIRKMIKADQEFSAVARACVLSSGDNSVISLLQSS